MKSDFEKLNEIWTAIKDVDEIYNSNSEDKIDDIINAVKSIDKKEFDQEAQNIIVSGFRNGLLNIYKQLFDSLNKGIDEIGGLASIQMNKTKPSNSTNAYINNVKSIEDVNNGSTQEYFGTNNDVEVIDESRNPSFLNGFSRIHEDD